MYGLVSPQKPPLVSEPRISLPPTSSAEAAESPFWLSISLTRKPACVVAGKVNRPIALCGVSVNCEVMVSGMLLCAE